MGGLRLEVGPKLMCCSHKLVKVYCCKLLLDLKTVVKSHVHEMERYL